MTDIVPELPIADVVEHLTTPDGNHWIGTEQYCHADKERRTEIRAAVGCKIVGILLLGVDGDLGDGALKVENIGNVMWHLMSAASEYDELEVVSEEAESA